MVALFVQSIVWQNIFKAAHIEHAVHIFKTAFTAHQITDKSLIKKTDEVGWNLIAVGLLVEVREINKAIR